MSAVLIFDMDGVIADSWNAFFPCCKDLLAALEQPQLCNQEAILRLFEDNFLTNLTRTIEPASIRAEHFLQFSSQLTNAMKKAPCFTGIKYILEDLSKKHTMYLLTANFTTVAKAFLNRHQLDYFQQVFGTDQTVNKTDKIRSIAEKYNGQSVFYIGDTLGDMLESRQAGVKTVAAGWGWHNKKTLAKGKPDYFLNSPEQLLTFIK